MIRVHESSSCLFIDLTSSATGYYYRKGSFNVQTALIVPSADYHVRCDRSCDILDDDLFGENIAYGFGSPVEHHWNSIRNFQVKGDLYPYVGFKQRIRTSPSKGDERLLNKLTGNEEYLLKVGTGNSDIGFVTDAVRYGVRPDGSAGRNKILHLYNGCVVCCMDTMRTLRPTDGTVLFTYCTYPGSKIDVYENSEGPTFAPYASSGGSLTTIGGRTTCNQLRLVNGRVYRYTLELDVTVPISASGNPRVWHSSFRDQLELELASSPQKWENGYYTSSTSLRGMSLSAIHMPNYEAIFPSKTRNPNWSSLAAEAYQDLNFSDINGLAFVKDAAEMGAMCSKFARTLKSLPSKRVKAAASAWLAVHYGFKLQLLDTKTLYHELEKQSVRDSRKSKCQAGTTYRKGRVSYSARYQVFYNQFDKLTDLYRQMMEISDFGLTLENVWDMIPYSFIIDWFISIGDILSSIDGYAKMTQEHKVIAVGRSIKGECFALPSMLGLEKEVSCNGVQITAYLRRYSTQLTLPSLLPSVTVNPFNHLVEGAALVISRK